MESPLAAPSVPLIETPRLRLRGHRLDDLAASAAMWADPAVIRYISDRLLTEEEAWARILRHVGHWTLLGFGYWVVEEKSRAKFVGELGFAELKRGLHPSIDGMPEIGWVLTSDVHGKGYATEAAQAAIDWGEGQFGAIRTCCIIHPENLTSIRVAEKCGYRKLRITRYRREPAILFTREPAASASA